MYENKFLLILVWGLTPCENFIIALNSKETRMQYFKLKQVFELYKIKNSVY